jgi:hypothetical protein
MPLDLSLELGLGPRKKKQRPDPSTEVTPSMIGSVGEKAIGGLSAVGNLLDLPGSMVRDLVGGANPVDQILSPFSDKNRTSGRDLLRKGGLVGKDDTYANWWGGLGTEIALDPLTYLTFGGSAASKAGQFAKAAGVADDALRVLAKKSGRTLGQVGAREARVGTTIDDMLALGGQEVVDKLSKHAQRTGKNLSEFSGQKLGGLVGFGMPFGMNPLAVFGTGGKSEKIARGLDTLGRGARFAKIPGTEIAPLHAVSKLFDPAAEHVNTPEGLAASRELIRRREAGRAAVRGVVARLAGDFERAGYGTQAQGRQVRAALEARNLNAIPQGLGLPVTKAQYAKQQLYHAAADWGVAPEFLDDPEARHFPRYITEGRRKSGGMTGQPLGGMHASRLGRADYAFGIKGGTNTLSSIAEDANLNALIDGGGSRKDIANYLKTTYGNVVPAQFVTKKQRNELKKLKLPPTVQAAQLAKQMGYKHLAPKNTYKAMGSHLASLSQDTRKSGIYGNHPLYDLEQHLLGERKSIAGSQTAMETLAQPGILSPGSNAARQVGTMKVGDLMRGLSIKDGPGLFKLADLMGINLFGMAPEDALQALKELKDMRLDKKLADDLLATKKGFDTPEAVGQIGKMTDPLTNLSKGLWTTPWPSFHGRNLVSGQVQNALKGMAGSQGEAHSLMRGSDLTGAGQIPVLRQMAAQRGINNPSDKEATELLRELIYAHDVTGRAEGIGQTATGQAGQLQGSSIEDIYDALPGKRPFSYKSMAKKAIGREQGTTLNPLKATYRGVGDATESTLGPMAAGADAGYLIEGLNRISPFIELLKQGVDPGEAAKRVGKAQVQYGNRHYTKMEQQLFSRLFPFYKFSRKAGEDLASELSQRPGGRTAQTIRAINRSRQPDELTPDYVSETASIPLGTGADGSRRYITGLGLMFENPLALASPSPRAGMLELLSQTNPLVKGPLEYATGETFFQRGPQGGRELDDLDPMLGRIMANVTGREKAVKYPGDDVVETVLANSPFSTGLAKVRQLTDKRKDVATKALNFGTGVRVTDISPAAQDALLREQLQEAERKLGAKSFLKRYFPAAEKEQMSPEDRKKVEQLEMLRKILEERAKSRAKAKAK